MIFLEWKIDQKTLFGCIAYLCSALLMRVGVLSPTRRMSCLSSQRMTSGPSSDSALKTPRRAMRTAAASWSNDDSMCWLWDCASAQLLCGGKEKKKVEKALAVEVNMGVVWMTHTSIGRRCQNQQECKYPSLRGQYWLTLTSQVCFLLNILRVHYNSIQVWDRNNFRLQFCSLTSWRWWWPEFSSVCWSAGTG